MVVGILGRDGTGKTGVAKAVGRYLARDDVTVIINTDMTLPTTIQPNSPLRSLGHYLSLVSRQPVQPYLQQHPKIKSLFFAGTAMLDDMFSYQVELDAYPQAVHFLKQCMNEAVHIVLDVSGQRNDPFLPVTTEYADKLVYLALCEAEGVNSLYAMERIFKSISCPVSCALSQTRAGHDQATFERAARHKVEYDFPFCNELAYANACGEDFVPQGRQGKQWDAIVRRLAEDVLKMKKQEALANG